MKLLTILTLIFVTGCVTKDSEEEVRNSLTVVLKDDLIEITKDVSLDALIDTPYYDITNWGKFDEGKYGYLAEVDFIFLKSVNKKVVRKYRYYTTYKKWDRYLNEYRSLN